MLHLGICAHVDYFKIHGTYDFTGNRHKIKINGLKVKLIICVDLMDFNKTTKFHQILDPLLNV